MRVAITGGSGFVGTHLANLLTPEHSVRVIDTRAPQAPYVEYVHADIRDPHRIKKALEHCDAVVHLAAVSNTRDAFEDPWRCMQVNCLGTATVLEAARSTGVGHVLVASSTLVSGGLVPVRMHWGSNCYDEDDELLPHLDAWVVLEESAVVLHTIAARHPYVTSKIFGESLARDYHVLYGVPVTILRFGILYGPMMTAGVVVDRFVRRALADKPLTIHGDGQQWRQYLHVGDLVAGVKAALLRGGEGMTYHLCPERKVTIAELAEEVCRNVPGTAVEYGPAREDDIEVRFCAASAARWKLGWEPRIDLEMGITQTVAWYRRNL